ncbi:hypothetical protein F4604DRAFT_1951322 [Suillus subluteus]|nr:hypothetical protein F4604DRAFT_1951322 [Suillus subluteus]
MSVPESDLGLLAPVLDAPTFQAWTSWHAAWSTHGPALATAKFAASGAQKLSGMVIAPWHITTRPSGSAFLASVAHLIVLPHTQTHLNLHVVRRATDVIGS